MSEDDLENKLHQTCLAELYKQLTEQVGYYELATGTGKTQLMFKACLKYHNSIILVPEHLEFEVGKQLDAFYRDNRIQNKEQKEIDIHILSKKITKAQLREYIGPNTHHVFIDEFVQKDEKLIEKQTINPGAKGLANVFYHAFNAYFPDGVKLNFQYSLQDATKDGILVPYHVEFESEIGPVLDKLAKETTKSVVIIKEERERELEQLGIRQYNPRSIREFENEDAYNIVYILLQEVEGLSIKFIETCVCCDAEQFTKEQLLQAIGRVVRKFPGKESAKVICVIGDEKKEAEVKKIIGEL